MNKQFKDLKYFKGWTLENFPFIEEDFDAITTYQFMCKIVEYLNEVIYNQKILDENGEMIKALVLELKEYVDKYLEDLTEIKEEITQIEDNISTLDGRVTENATNITNLDTKIDSEISSLKAYTDNIVNTNYNTLKEYVDFQDSVLDEKIDNIQIGQIQVYNPTNGLVQPLQIVLNDLYESGNRDSITASEYDALELTATYYDGLDITAREYDTSAKTILT